MQATLDPGALQHVLTQFAPTPVRLQAIEALGAGHIHDTYLVTLSAPTPTPITQNQWVLQRINTHVFTNVPAMMENIARVTAHVRACLERAGTADLARRALSLRLTRDGSTYWVEPQSADAEPSSLGRVFRVFDYIPRSLALSVIERPADAFEAGRAVGEFARCMADLPAPPLHVTLPGFHAPEQRFLQLRAALDDDPVGRAQTVTTEWQAILARQTLAHECAAWAQRGLALRVAHNDTKLNNVLFDRDSRRALCVLDLDTVMPGYVAFDFGDLVRTCVCTQAEDAHADEPLALRFDVFEALARGYLSQMSECLTALEHESLARGALWIVLELAMRFLTDHVNGDRYFKVARPDHNLQRARAQLRLLHELERHSSELSRTLAACR